MASSKCSLTTNMTRGKPLRSNVLVNDLPIATFSFRAHITLLETETPAKGFRLMPFTKTQFPNLLVSSNILNGPPHASLFPSSSSINNPAIPLGTHVNAAMGPPHASPLPSSSSINNPATPLGTHANAAMGAASIQRYVYPVDAYVNPFNQRVDIALPKLSLRDHAELEKLKAYIQMCNETRIPTPCNDYYLKGACHHHPCEYDHNVRLSAAQCTELAKMARKFDCQTGTSCRDPECMFAHNCPFDAKGGKCGQGRNCWLIKFHGINTRQKTLWQPGPHANWL